MDAIEKQPPTSLLRIIARWIGDFERAIEMRPVDQLEQRVADLERRIAGLTEPLNGKSGEN